MDLVNPRQTEFSSFPFRTLQALIVGLGLVSGLLYFFNFRMQSWFSPARLISKTGLHFYIFLFMALSLLYFIGVYLLLKHRSDKPHSKRLVVILITFAVIFRVFLIPADPEVLSKDMYRYIWDGRVQQNGINPYPYAPDADELKKLRDNRIYPNINRKSYPTLYPAGAQLFFRIFHLIVGDSVNGYKGLMTLFDLLTLFVLLALLRICGFEEKRIIIYAWNPLVIFEIAYSGHLEGLTVFWMVLALYLNAARRQMLGVLSLSIAAAIKLYPALLLPALLNPGQRMKGIITFMFAVVLLYLPFLAAGSKVLGFLPIYLQEPYESFNRGLKYLLIFLWPQLSYYLLSKVFLAALIAAGLFVFLKPRKRDETIRYAYILTGSLMVLMPASLHPWYVIILIPFLCFFPAVAWLLFSCTVTLSYIKYVIPTGIMPISVRVLEYGLLFILLAGGYFLKWTGRKKRYAGGPGWQEYPYFLEHDE